MSWIRDLFPGPSPAPSRIAAYLALLIGLTGLASPDLFQVRADRLVDGHAISSMDLAITRAFCHSGSQISPAFTPAIAVRDHPELMPVPIRQVIADRQGSVEKFCAGVQDDFVNTENALLWIESWLFRLSPNLSVDGLGDWLHRIRVTMLVVVAGLLLSNGAGVIVTTASWWWALILLQQLRQDVTSTFPFVFVLPLLTAVVFATASARGALTSRMGMSAFSIAMGAWAAFGVNMRSSHLPIYLALFVVALCLGSRGAPRWQGVVLAASLFFAAYSGFQYLAITQYAPKSQALTSHAIIHPLLLALAVPESDFSRREGLLWDDPAGAAIGRRLDPSAPYASPAYERALLTHYFQLWREHPGEVMGVYATKAKVAGKSMLSVIRWQRGRTGSVVNVILAPLDLLPNGLYLLATYVLVLAGFLVVAWKQRGGAIVWASLSMVALLMQIESTIIVSLWVAKYHAYLAWYVVVLSVGAPLLAAGIALGRWQSPASAAH